ncbi:MAG: hypothetical protein MJE66_14850 [Proteobacteria bacterium]|nr:hypothetical protein [Pseudomonadota bacterium]
MLYTAVVHQGLGVPQGGFPTAWYHPSGFLIDWDVTGRYQYEVRGVPLFALPALLLALAACVFSRSAIVWALSFSAAIAVPLYAYYGLVARFPWEFFHWRASLVLTGIALAIGCAAAAPALARSWLRLRPAFQFGLYALLFFGIVALLRNPTGTNESLPFNFSPWPAIPVFGLELGAYGICGVLLGVAGGLAALAFRRERPLLALGLGLVGLAFPAVWFAMRFGGDTRPAVVLTAITTLALVGAALGPWFGERGPTRSQRLWRRASHFALGATLAAVPLLAGRGLATGDYVATKHVRARVVSDALARYYTTQGEYPDSLELLIEAGELDSIPVPRVGFSFLNGWGDDADGVAFDYRSLGSSYVLEFETTEWVQCAYNPPWEDEEEDDFSFGVEGEDDFEDEEEESDGDDAWSCPESRPQLW